MVNGCNIQNYVKSNNKGYGDKIENEITGIVYIEERKLSLAVGWSRKIVSYHDEPLEVSLFKRFNAKILNLFLFRIFW